MTKLILEIFFYTTLAFWIICISLTITRNEKRTAESAERIEILVCQVNRILHPGLVDEGCGGK